nr:hypothetical protein BCU61_16905 [Vibrio splendidus]PMJ31766.1 hypothetical protein BCU26_02225 [Vibrio splendidus]PMN22117.1 hypothetical protein BCT37_12455 [Vibrio cyclitrophicus]
MGSYSKSKPSLEHFEELNTLSMVTKPDDHVIPRELEKALIEFIELAYENRVEKNGAHYIDQLVNGNSAKIDPNVSLAAITGLHAHVVNTTIRQVLIDKMNKLAEEQQRGMLH